MAMTLALSFVVVGTVMVAVVPAPLLMFGARQCCP